MVEFILRNGRPSLILFVHGFTGSKETWKHANHPSFPELMASNGFVKSHFDIAYFNYYTKLSTKYGKARNISRLAAMLFGATEKLQNNNSIEEVAEILRTELRVRLDGYQDIVVVAHSMGGLVAKSCILKDVADQSLSPIKLFISLAVPHHGATAAVFGKLISSNLNVGELAPLSVLSSTLNDKWLKTSLRPQAKYFYGTNDSIVAKTSAVPADREKQDVSAVNDDHLSISKPEGVDSTVYLAVLKALREYVEGAPEKGLVLKRLEDDQHYEDEVFVLKLIVADIHRSTITNAKELFLNAEYARKLFNTEMDRRKFEELYVRIRDLYKDSYDKLLNQKIRSPAELLVDVHEKIVSEDTGYLKAHIPFVGGIHKKGMLHQLANDLAQDVWWTEQKTFSKDEK